MIKYCDTIGVIGGMGSYSTLHFFERFLKSFNAEEEYERPRIVIDNYCTLPNKVRAYLYNEKAEELLSNIISSLEHLTVMGCTKNLIVCNVTHVFMEEIFKRSPDLKKNFVDMIECLSEKLYYQGVRKVLVWTTRNTIKAEVFEKYLYKYDIEIVYDIDNNEEIINELMWAGEHNILNEHVGVKYSELCNLYDKSFPIILGCTELSIINSMFYGECNLQIYDPIECVLEYILQNLK